MKASDHELIVRGIEWVTACESQPLGALMHPQGMRAELSDGVLVLSGRAGFEIVQKAARAGIPVVAAVGAPSSLALRIAERSGMTLIGFLSAARFNLYTGAGRLL